MTDAKTESKSESTKAASLKTILGWLDSDKNGDLVKAEMKKFADGAKKKVSLEKLMAMADLNKDGKVSAEEFGTFMDNVLKVTFAKIDSNKNGSIDDGEVASLVLVMVNGTDFKDVSAGFIDGVRADAAKHFGKRSANFEQFAEYVLALIAGTITNCKGKDVEQQIGHLVDLSITASDWQTLTGSDSLAKLEQSVKDEAEMEAKITAAMEVALKAEADAKSKADEKAKTDRAKIEADREKITVVSGAPVAAGAGAGAPVLTRPKSNYRENFQRGQFQLFVKTLT